MNMIERSLVLTKNEFSREKWPFYWLTKVSGRYLERLEPRLKKIGLDVSRWRVLSCLAEDEQISISEIAEQAIVKMPTMMKIVQRMESDGLVSMATRASDGRVTEVSLTEKGLRARDEALVIAQEIYDRCFADVAEDEREALNAQLRLIFIALGQ